MNAVVPRARLEAVIEPHYPKSGKVDLPIGVPRMLRVYFLQQSTMPSDHLVAVTVSPLVPGQ